MKSIIFSLILSVVCFSLISVQTSFSNTQRSLLIKMYKYDHEYFNKMKRKIHDFKKQMEITNKEISLSYREMMLLLEKNNKQLDGLYKIYSKRGDTGSIETEKDICYQPLSRSSFLFCGDVTIKRVYLSYRGNGYFYKKARLSLIKREGKRFPVLVYKESLFVILLGITRENLEFTQKNHLKIPAYMIDWD